MRGKERRSGERRRTCTCLQNITEGTQIDKESEQVRVWCSERQLLLKETEGNAKLLVLTLGLRGEEVV